MTEIATRAPQTGRFLKEDDTTVNLGDMLSVYGSTTIITPTINATTIAYTSGDSIGGVIAITGAMRTSGGTGILQSVFVVDHSNQKPALDILIFDSTPTATATDNGAMPTFAAADNGRLIRRISIATGDYVTVGGTGIADISALGKAVKANGSADLAMIINTTSTPTLTATTDLTVRLGFLRD